MWNKTYVKMYFFHAPLRYLFLEVSTPYGVFAEGEYGCEPQSRGANQSPDWMGGRS